LGRDSGLSYDALDGLTGVSGFGSTSFTYDALGNRATKGTGSPQVTYSYSSTTLRLTSASSSIGVPETGTFTYDDTGNMTGDGTGTYTYSSRNQMLSATLSGTPTRYQYDGSGLRALKSGPNGQSYYIHGPPDQAGLPDDAREGSSPQLFVIGHGDRRGCVRGALLHHDVTATSPNLGKALRLENVADLCARQNAEPTQPAPRRGSRRPRRGAAARPP